MELFLSDDELQELTGYRQRAAQVRALRFMGIEHRVRPDGRPAVLRAHVQHAFSGPRSANVVQDTQEPDWSAL